MTVGQKPVTAEELLHTPDDGHVRQHDLGAVFAAETGFQIDRNPDTVRAPDVAFVRRERIEAVGDTEGYWPEAPDLAVEVVSPGDKFSEVDQKIEDWLAAGTRMVMLVNPRGQNVTIRLPEKRVEVLTVGETVDGGDVVPGWGLAVSDVFH